MVQIAVFGASKGCANAMVVQGLENENYKFKVLLRKPDQSNFTKDQKEKITIIQGDALDINAVKETIKDADIIVSSVGSGFDFKRFKMSDAGVCEKAMAVLVEALKDLDKKPKRLLVVSSAGVHKTSEVPLLLRPFYRYVLADPHADKRAMESLVVNHAQVSDYVIVRPSMLTDGKLTGHYRSATGIAGYTVSRNDVGHFLLTQLGESTEFTKKDVVVTY